MGLFEIQPLIDELELVRGDINLLTKAIKALNKRLSP